MNESIVIAEDESDLRNNLVRLLRMEGYDVHAAVNGREALKLVQEHRPALLLSDVGMPEMSGHELIAALRADPAAAHMQMVLLTARADRSDIRTGMNLGADDYLTKPFQRAELLDCIRSRLDRARNQSAVTQRLAEQAHRLTHYDPVTDLPNRTHFLLLLEEALTGLAAQSRTGTAPLPVAALWMIGLDNLTQMAQVTGPTGADRCVREIAQRLAQAAAELLPAGSGHCLCARTGDDRLVLLAPQWPAERSLEPVAEHLLQRLGAALTLAAEEFFPLLSAGCLLVAAGGSSAHTVSGRVELALHNARIQPGLRISQYRDNLTPEISSAWRLQNDLHRTVERNELELFLQPQLTAASGKVFGFEALMRWRHPELGLVPPVRFIPLAEDNGQIVPMGAWMLGEACTAARQWPAHLGLRVAINLSARQFADPGLFDHVRIALDKSQLPPGQLELEITESTIMQDVQRTLDLLRRFKDMGVKLAIDDFGTGYSSLAYLKRFPLDVLKIDQSFVSQLCTDRDDQAIANAVIQLAHSLGLRVIAEGVETEAQLAMLREMGCDDVQGYLHGRPMTPADAAVWLQQHGA